MTELLFLRDLGLILVAAAVFAVLARTIRMPAIAAFLFAGIALGPVTGLVQVSEALDLISHTGIALLLFLVGLELSVEKIRDVGGTAVVAGVGQILLTFLAAAGLGLALGFPLRHAAFLALAMTISSTVVVVKLLDQRRELDSLHGRIAVGVLMVQDLVVILVLTLIAGLGEGESGFVGGLLRAFAGTAVMLAVALAAARWLLPRPFAWLGRSSEGMFIWALCWCFAMALGAEALHLSLEIGAFLAGVSLAQLPWSHELRIRVHPLTNFFIAVFFVTLGVQLDPGAIVEDPLAVFAFTAFVLVLGPVLVMVLLARLRFGERTAFLGGITLGQVSEFSFVLAAAALAAGFIDERVLSIIGVVGFATIAASSWLVLNGDVLFERLRSPGLLRWLGAAGGSEGAAQEPRRDHIVVVGMNSLGRGIARGLAERGASVLAVDTDAAKLQDLPTDTLLGSTDHVEVLEEAGIVHARLVVSALRIADANRMLAWRCRELGVPVAVHAFDQDVTRDLQALGADYLITSKNEGVRRIAERFAADGLLD